MEICKRDKCTGCFACKNICPKEAIVVETDKLGKTVPGILEEKCVECGLCRKVCPEYGEKNLVFPKKCYAIWTKNEKDREECASGGVATGIGRYFISNGGVVFGTDWNEKKELELEIKMAETEAELERFRASKYVQAFTGDSFKSAKQQLDQGREVLYIGTPCQIAGLKGYLQKEYENLTTMDLICHGTPPIEYLRNYVKEILPQKRIVKASFRGKDDYYLKLYENKSAESVYSKMHILDLYFCAFLRGLIQRDNCYKCEYARNERISDITIGDFWGLDRSALKKKYEGNISVALVNTDKGKKILEQCSARFYMEERPIEEAIEGNDQLRKPATLHEDYGKFSEDYTKKGFSAAVKSTRIKNEIFISNIKQSFLVLKLKKIVRKVINYN